MIYLELEGDNREGKRAICKCNFPYGTYFSNSFFLKIRHDCWYDRGWKESSHKQHH